MDLTIRDWMIVIGAGLILLVLADAVRRVYQDRRSEVRIVRSMQRAVRKYYAAVRNIIFPPPYRPIKVDVI